MKQGFTAPTGSKTVRPSGPTSDSIERKLWEKLIKLPLIPTPKGNYLPVLKHDKTLYVSGQLPLKDGSLGSFVGRHGREISVDGGQRAAQICTLNALALAKNELGSLEKIKRVIKVTGYVSGMPGFTDHSLVMNGASDFLVELFGEAGKHVRTVVGVTDLPFGSCIEIEYIFEIK
ncbi:MAG: RidA family protein [Deltaproteobacteria bacterium]|nr:RidA family protein [Deltaproteobacteria bacterium]